MTKQELRNDYIERRRQLESSDIHVFSENILTLFRTLNFSDIHFLHIFYPMTGKHEVDSLLLAEWIRNKYPEIRLLLPKTNLTTHRLEHIIWTEETPLAMNKWGITEPEHGESIQPELIDMVIVPLLAFDKLGNRLGYGKGFYDRFLKECREDVIKAGLSFFDPEELLEEMAEHDVPLDLCITPTRIWKFHS